jgi:hypothetical protein
MYTAAAAAAVVTAAAAVESVCMQQHSVTAAVAVVQCKQQQPTRCARRSTAVLGGTIADNYAPALEHRDCVLVQCYQLILAAC